MKEDKCSKYIYFGQNERRELPSQRQIRQDWHTIFVNQIEDRTIFF